MTVVSPTHSLQWFRGVGWEVTAITHVAILTWGGLVK